MFSKGIGFFKRSYHVPGLGQNMDILMRFMCIPQFKEAKNRNHINFNDMNNVDSALLEDILGFLFSPDNAQKTIDALNSGDFSFQALLKADPVKRQLYLRDFAGSETTSAAFYRK